MVGGLGGHSASIKLPIWWRKLLFGLGPPLPKDITPD